MEIGKWYKNGGCLFCFVKETDSDIIGYGFDFGGKWHNLKGGWIKSKTEATKEEVESALRAEAIKKGFKAGVQFNSVFGNSPSTFKGSPSFYPTLGFNLYGSNYSGCIYSDGKWAEIVKPQVKINVEDNLSPTIERCIGKPTITVYDIDRKELGKIYRTDKYYLHIGNEIIECSSVEDCLTKMD